MTQPLSIEDVRQAFKSYCGERNTFTLHASGSLTPQEMLSVFTGVKRVLEVDKLQHPQFCINFLPAKENGWPIRRVQFDPTLSPPVSFYEESHSSQSVAA